MVEQVLCLGTVGITCWMRKTDKWKTNWRKCRGGANNFFGVQMRCWARTCVASVQVNTRAVVSAPAAHHVVLEIRLRHIQGRVDLHLWDKPDLRRQSCQDECPRTPRKLLWGRDRILESITAPVNLSLKLEKSVNAWVLGFFTLAELLIVAESVSQTLKAQLPMSKRVEPVHCLQMTFRRICPNLTK